MKPTLLGKNQNKSSKSAWRCQFELRMSKQVLRTTESHVTPKSLCLLNSVVQAIFIYFFIYFLLRIYFLKIPSYGQTVVFPQHVDENGWSNLSYVILNWDYITFSNQGWMSSYI